MWIGFLGVRSDKIFIERYISLCTSDYTVSPYGYIANVTRSGIWLLRLDVILLNTAVHSYVHNFPPLAPILSQMILVLPHPLP
jgi:hypothetical protein